MKASIGNTGTVLTRAMTRLLTQWRAVVVMEGSKER